MEAFMYERGGVVVIVLFDGEGCEVMRCGVQEEEIVGGRGDFVGESDCGFGGERELETVEWEGHSEACGFDVGFFEGPDGEEAVRHFSLLELGECGVFFGGEEAFA